MSQKTLQSGKQVFVSFEYERDYGKARDLIARAHRRGYAKPIFDHSLKEPYEVSTGEWVNKARTAIQRSQLVIVIIGSDTRTAPGVEREIKLA